MEKISYHGIAVVTAWLEESGYWFPPDAIRAVYEGRDTYHALDERIIYNTSRCELPVQHAIQRARDNGWNMPSRWEY